MEQHTYIHEHWWMSHALAPVGSEGGPSPLHIYTHTYIQTTHPPVASNGAIREVTPCLAGSFGCQPSPEEAHTYIHSNIRWPQRGITVSPYNNSYTINNPTMGNLTYALVAKCRPKEAKSIYFLFFYFLLLSRFVVFCFCFSLL